MKEKRVDILLAKAAFCQMVVLASGGALLTEMIDFNTARPNVLTFSGIAMTAFVVATIGLYSRASRLSKKQKKKSHESR